MLIFQWCYFVTQSCKLVCNISFSVILESIFCWKKVQRPELRRFHCTANCNNISFILSTFSNIYKTSKNYLNVFLSSWIIKDYQYKWNNSFIFSYFTPNFTSLQCYFWKYFKIIYWFEKFGLFYSFTFCRYLKSFLLLKYFWILKVTSIIYGNLNI